jgi:hypothetical protein
MTLSKVILDSSSAFWASSGDLKTYSLQVLYCVLVHPPGFTLALNWTHCGPTFCHQLVRGMQHLPFPQAYQGQVAAVPSPMSSAWLPWDPAVSQLSHHTDGSDPTSSPQFVQTMCDLICESHWACCHPWTNFSFFPMVLYLKILNSSTRINLFGHVCSLRIYFIEHFLISQYEVMHIFLYLNYFSLPTILNPLLSVIVPFPTWLH